MKSKTIGIPILFINIKIYIFLSNIDTYVYIFYIRDICIIYIHIYTDRHS